MKENFHVYKDYPFVCIFPLYSIIKNWSFLSTLPKKVQICFSRIHSHLDFYFIFETYWTTPPQNGPIYQLCIFYIFLITGNMLTRSEPSLDMDPGSSVWISVRITPTLYPGVYWAGFFKNAQNMFNKTCVLFEICLEFCKNLWNMEWDCLHSTKSTVKELYALYHWK